MDVLFTNFGSTWDMSATMTIHDTKLLAGQLVQEEIEFNDNVLELLISEQECTLETGGATKFLPNAVNNLTVHIALPFFIENLRADVLKEKRILFVKI